MFTALYTPSAVRLADGAAPGDDTHRVTSADGAALDGMLDRVLTATTLREALG